MWREFRHLYHYFLALFTFRVRNSRDEMYIGHGRLRVSVCVSARLSLAAFPHYSTDPDETWGDGTGVPALLGGFVIGVRVSLLRKHSAECEMSASACTRSMDGSISRRRRLKVI